MNRDGSDQRLLSSIVAVGPSRVLAIARAETVTVQLVLSEFSSNTGGWTSQDEFPRLLGDVNGDGWSDIVGFGAAATYTALGQANGTFSAPIPVLSGFRASQTAGGWESQDLYPRVLGDVNGDGRDDIVGFGEAGAYTALGQADGTFASPILALNSMGTSVAAGGWASEDQCPRLVGDVNGDGRADIVGFGFAGTVTALGQSDGSFGPLIASSSSFGGGTAAGGWTTQAQYPRVLGDVDGDGCADIVGFGEAGVYIALGQADDTFRPPVFAIPNYGSAAAAGGWSSNDIYPRLAADVNRDDRADIVGFAAFGVFVTLSQASLLAAG
jgi:hypothetical protein